MFSWPYKQIYLHALTPTKHWTAVFQTLLTMTHRRKYISLDSWSAFHSVLFCFFNSGCNLLNWISWAVNGSQSEIHFGKDVCLPDPLTVMQFVSNLFLLQTMLYEYPHTGLPVHMHENFSKVKRSGIARSKYIHTFWRGKGFEKTVDPWTTSVALRRSTYTGSFSMNTEQYRKCIFSSLWF